jgi:GTP-binding protein
MKILNVEVGAVASQPSGFPVGGPPEVAFLGRSNVGKSSLLNGMAQRKKLARTSSTPGKTRLVHWYNVKRSGGDVSLVDLPGYGFAKVSKAERLRWKQLVESYLDGRAALRAAVLLQDLRRDFREDEALLLDWLAEREIPVLLALTKVDKLKPMRRAVRVRELRRDAGLPAAQVIATSAEKKTGLNELWGAINGLL